MRVGVNSDSLDYKPCKVAYSGMQISSVWVLQRSADGCSRSRVREEIIFPTDGKKASTPGCLAPHVALLPIKRERLHMHKLQNKGNNLICPSLEHDRVGPSANCTVEHTVWG